MRQWVLVLASALLAGGAYLFFDKFEVRGWNDLEVAPRTQTYDDVPQPQVGSRRDTVRVASFNIQVYGTTKASKPHVMESLANIIRRFDVVAIQEIRSLDQDVVPRLVEVINAPGRKYDYVIGPRLGRTVSKEQYAYIFDTATIEVDRHALYTVSDPDDLLHREPYVAWFRVRGPPPDAAFTFTLVNIHTDPDEAREEVDTLAQVYHGVRNDGRGEDDVIIIGDLNVDHYNLGRLGQIPGMVAAIAGPPTNTRGTAAYDNIVFHQPSTTEYTGRSGVFDFMREFNLTLEQALEISDHLPVWAEFSVYEGGQPGRIATQPGEAVR